MNDILVTDARTGETLPGIPTPLLIQNGGGEAYFVPASDSRSSIPGVWYLHCDGYEAPDGEYRKVRIRTVDRYPGV